MSNPATLIQIQTRPDAQRLEIAKKGGHATKGVFRVSKTRNCNQNCVMYGRCWASSASNKYDGKCALAQAPDQVSRRTVMAITGGERAYCDLMLELITEIEARTRQDPSLKNLRELNREFRESYPLLWGSKQRIVAQVESKVSGVAEIAEQIRSVLKTPKESRNATEADVAKIVDAEVSSAEHKP